jgi:hypothetical protein
MRSICGFLLKVVLMLEATFIVLYSFALVGSRNKLEIFKLLSILLYKNVLFVVVVVV